MPALRDIRFLVACLLFATAAALSAQLSGHFVLNGLAQWPDNPDAVFLQRDYLSELPSYPSPSERLEAAAAIVFMTACRDTSLSCRQEQLSGRNAFGKAAKGAPSPDLPGVIVYPRLEAELKTLHSGNGHGKDKKQSVPSSDRAAHGGLAAFLFPSHSVAANSGVVFVLPGTPGYSSGIQSDAPRAGPAVRIEVTEEKGQMPAPSC